MKTFFYFLLIWSSVKLSACKQIPGNQNKTVSNKASVRNDTLKKSQPLITDTLHVYLAFAANKINNRIDLYYKRRISPIPKDSSTYIFELKYTYLDSLTKVQGNMPDTVVMYLAGAERENLSWSNTPDSIKNIDYSSTAVSYVHDKLKDKDRASITVVDINDDKIEDLLVYNSEESGNDNKIVDLWIGQKNNKYKHLNDFFQGGVFYWFEKQAGTLYFVTGWNGGGQLKGLEYSIERNNRLYPQKGYIHNLQFDYKLKKSVIDDELYLYKGGKKITTRFTNDSSLVKAIKQRKMPVIFFEE